MEPGDVPGPRAYGPAQPKSARTRSTADWRQGRCPIYDCVRQLLFVGAAAVVSRQLNPNAWIAEKNVRLFRALGSRIPTCRGYAVADRRSMLACHLPMLDQLKAVQLELMSRYCFSLRHFFPTGYMAAENCDIKSGDRRHLGMPGPVGRLRFVAHLCWELKSNRNRSVCGASEHGARQAGQTSPRTSTTSGRAEMDDRGRGPDSASTQSVRKLTEYFLVDAYDSAKQSLKVSSDRPDRSALWRSRHAARRQRLQCPVYTGISGQDSLYASFAKD